MRCLHQASSWNRSKHQFNNRGFCIADVTGNNPNVLYEIGLAQGINKPLIFLAQEGSTFPFDIAYHRFTLYGSDLAAAGESLQAAISHALGDRLREAVQLLKDGQYRAAIAIAAISLEQRLICLLSGDSYNLFRGRGLTQMLRELKKQHLISRDDAERLAPVVKLRNMAVHANDAVPTRHDAELAITSIQQFLAERTTENCR